MGGEYVGRWETEERGRVGELRERDGQRQRRQGREEKRRLFTPLSIAVGVCCVPLHSNTHSKCNMHMYM